MRYRNRNPFERDVTQKPLLRVVIFTPSFDEELAQNTEVATKLLHLALFDYCEIIFTPPQSKEADDALGVRGVKVHPYELTKAGVVLKNEWATYTKSYLAAWQVPENPEALSGHNSLLTNSDLAVARSIECDYFVFADSAEQDMKAVGAPGIVSFSEFLNFLRVLLTNQGIFYTSPGGTVNEGFYYLYRYKKIFGDYQLAWSTAVAVSTSTQVKSDLYWQLDSLAGRLDAVCRALDKTLFFALKKANNDTLDNALYHLGYLILLSAGIFDDLAWLINFRYAIGLERRAIFLRKDENVRANRPLYQYLYANNRELHRYLTDPETQKYLRLLTSLRDPLAHRIFLRGGHLSRGSEQSIMFRSSPEVVERLLEVSPEDGAETWGLRETWHDLVDLYPFTVKAFGLVAEIVNGVLQRLEWNQLIGTLSAEQQAFIREDQAKLQRGVWRFLNWSEEPMYF